MKYFKYITIIIVLYLNQATDSYSQSNPGNWLEGNPIYPPEYIYTGVGMYYNEPVVLRQNQAVAFLFQGVIYTRVDVKYNGGSWQTIKNTHGSGQLIFNHPWTQPGAYNLDLRWFDVDGNPHDHDWTVYVTPPAQKYFYDSNGNHMLMWNNGGAIDSPLLIIEGFDPTNKNNANLYFAGGQNFLIPAIEDNKDVFVFQFANGGADMLANAIFVNDAIKFINSIKNGSTPLKLIGVSMGGVIGRYVLAKAEAENDILNVSHFVSMDSPQQGAVMDPSFLNYVLDKDEDNPGLNSIAAKQLLKYNPFDATGTIHETFYLQLKAMNGDGYPNQTTTIGVAFSHPNQNQNIGKWLTVNTAFNSPAEFFITAEKDVYESGSYLPLSSTRVYGSGNPDWLPDWVTPGLVPYDFSRTNNHPSFIQHSSALDLNSQGNTKFDIAIHTSQNHFHDEIPVSIVGPLLLALDIESPNHFYENRTITTNSSYSNETIEIADNVTVTIQGTITMNNLIVTLGTNSSIVVSGSGKITADGTTFTSVDPSNPALAFNRIELNSSGNTFTKSTFKGGNNQNVLVKKSGNIFTESTFSHSKVGLNLFSVTAEATLVASTITQNTQHGAYVDGGTLRLNGFTRNLPSNQFWEKIGYDPSSIHGNTGNGVTLIGTGKLYTSHSRVMDNTGIQISVGNDARMYAQELNSSGLSGLNRISKTTSGYYIYSTARTVSGETYQNLTIPARYNYWGGGSEPVAARFFGPVDANFKLTEDLTVPYITMTCIVSNCDGKAQPGQIASILSSAMTMSITEGASTPEVAERLITAKERIIAIRNYISAYPDDPFNARLLREWHGLLQTDEASAWTDEKQIFSARIETRKNQHASDMVLALSAGRRSGSGREVNAPSDLFRPDSELEPKHLIGETAWILSLAELANKGEFEELLNQAGSHSSRIYNADNRASVQVYRMQALQSLGRYEESISALNELEQIQPSADMQTWYIAQDYGPTRRHLAELAGVDVQSTLAKANSIAAADGTPHAFALHPSYPNPFNPTTTVRYSVGGGSGSSVQVRIAVFDLLGREVAVLVEERKQAGEYSQVFDATGVASGIYLIHARLGTQVFSHKITLIK